MITVVARCLNKIFSHLIGRYLMDAAGAPSVRMSNDSKPSLYRILAAREVGEE
jgi:hypothetical protein